jgi:hypothetical protein
MRTEIADFSPQKSRQAIRLGKQRVNSTFLLVAEHDVTRIVVILEKFSQTLNAPVEDPRGFD